VKELVAIVEAALRAKSTEEVGEHTEETLYDLGSTLDQMAELKRTKVI
jgi:crotonobetainyl-CoA:carnitine CoA-transferase CaiB-like acyl-CoA transferase